MAKSTTAAEAPKYDPDAEYDVTLAKVVTLFGIQFLPLHQHTMTGRTLLQLVEENGADVVAAATPVA